MAKKSNKTLFVIIGALVAAVIIFLAVFFISSTVVANGKVNENFDEAKEARVVAAVALTASIATGNTKGNFALAEWTDYSDDKGSGVFFAFGESYRFFSFELKNADGEKLTIIVRTDNGKAEVKQ